MQSFMRTITQDSEKFFTSKDWLGSSYTSSICVTELSLCEHEANKLTTVLTGLTKRSSLFLVHWKNNYIEKHILFSLKRCHAVCFKTRYQNCTQDVCRRSYVPFVLSNYVINQTRLLWKFHKASGPFHITVSDSCCPQ